MHVAPTHGGIGSVYKSCRVPAKAPWTFQASWATCEERMGPRGDNDSVADPHLPRLIERHCKVILFVTQDLPGSSSWQGLQQAAWEVHDGNEVKAAAFQHSPKQFCRSRACGRDEPTDIPSYR